MTAYLETKVGVTSSDTCEPFYTFHSS